MVRGNATPLESGMVASIEPMIVVPGEFGVRLEDHFYMTTGRSAVVHRASEINGRPVLKIEQKPVTKHSDHKRHSVFNRKLKASFKSDCCVLDLDLESLFSPLNSVFRSESSKTDRYYASAIHWIQRPNRDLELFFRLKPLRSHKSQRYLAASDVA